MRTASWLLAGVLLANFTDFISPAVMHWTRSGDLIVTASLAGLIGMPMDPIYGAWPRATYSCGVNTDGKGQSYGTHENYLMRRSTPFADIVRHLTPFFVSRQVICGAGRVGS